MIGNERLHVIGMKMQKVGCLIMLPFLLLPILGCLWFALAMLFS